jgi:signal transduction histidine kinase
LAATPDHVTLGPSAEINGEAYFHTTIDLRRRSETRQGRVLHILFPQAEYRRAWREAFVPAAVIGMGAVAAVAAVAHLVARRISRAAARVGQEVARLARGDFAPAPLPPTDDELRDLSIAVNRTAEMLADYEQQVRRTEQVRVVGMLGASLAHEMRNAATGCRVALDLHAESCSASGEEESLVVAKRQLRLMESQLQRFLQVGRASSDPTEKADVDLRKMIEDLLPLVRPAAQHARVQLEWRPPAGLLAVRAAEEELSQVVLNLVLNALEAVSHHGEHGERRVSVAALPADAGKAEIVVSDTGPGPANGVAAAIFDPFVTSKAEGAGLGLAVAKQVVEAHNGAIRWNRDNGVTRFSVTLPLAMKG